MPTIEERLASLELRAEQNASRIREVLEVLNSGPSVPWDQSVSGKLHAMKNQLASADKLAEAAREVRRARRTTLTMFERLLLAVCAIAAAVAPYVVLLLH